MKMYLLKESNKLVATQGEAKKSGEEWELWEVPTTSKPDMLEYLNSLLTDEQVADIPDVQSVTPSAPCRPDLTEEERSYVALREQVSAGRVDLDEILWEAPLDLCLRLSTIIHERIREHYVKGKSK